MGFTAFMLTFPASCPKITTLGGCYGTPYNPVNDSAVSILRNEHVRSLIRSSFISFAD
jgi:hypothetical protein